MNSNPFHRLTFNGSHASIEMRLDVRNSRTLLCSDLDKNSLKLKRIRFVFIVGNQLCDLNKWQLGKNSRKMPTEACEDFIEWNGNICIDAKA